HDGRLTSQINECQRLPQGRPCRSRRQAYPGEIGMRNVWRLIVYVVIAALAVPGGTSVAARQVTQDSRTLVVGVAFDIKSLDQARAFEPAGVMILKATYDTLLTLDEHDVSRIMPDLAESWEVSPDARTFTFRLRHDVIFQSSGNPTTSADVKWSLERAMG